MQPKGAPFFSGELMARPRKTGLDWIAIDVNSPDHPKVKRIAKYLNVSPVEAFGYFVAFLCYVGQFYPSGDVTECTDEEINDAARCVKTNSNDGMSFADILRTPDVRMLRKNRRGKVRVNGWTERNGRFWRQLQLDRKRKVFHVLSDGKPAENGGKTGGFSNVPDRTLPDHTGPKEKDTSPPAPHRKIADAWNALASSQNLPRVVNLSEKRRTLIRSRWRDPHWRTAWKEALAKVSACPFLLGENDRGWRANFDWFLRPDTVTKITEGAYDGRPKQDRALGPRHFGGDTKDTEQYAELERADRAAMEGGDAEEGST